MKNYLLIFFILFCSTFVFAQGTIQGRVIDENGLGMPGATLQISELTNRITVSDINGRFTYVNVPAGDYTLSVSFVGYEKKEERLSVASGSTASIRISMAPGVIMGDEILVLGDRLKGQAKALNQQRNSGNVTNIVASDQIGRFPDANIGDAMKRIPGITMQNDQGEARDIIIRGLAPQLNSVTLNGERIPSAEGDNRRVQMDLIPSDMIQMIEVNKAVLPSMDADAIGGSVNLVTRKAPSGFRFSGTAASGVNLLTDKPIWTGGVIIGDRIANDKLGIILSASYNNHTFGSDNYEARWVQTNRTDYPVTIDRFDLRKYDVQRVRRSASLALDYEISPNHTIALNTMYNWRDDWENRFRMRVDRLNQFTNFAELSENLYNVRGRMAVQTKGGVDSDRVKATRLEEQKVANVTLSGDHQFNSLKMTWNTTYAKASEDRPEERYITHRGNAQMTVDIRDPFKTLVTQQDLDSEFGLGLNEIYESNNNTSEEDFNARFDFMLPFAENKGVLKFGGRLRDKTKQRNNSYDIYDPINDLTPNGNTLGALPNESQTSREFLNGPQYIPGNFVTREYLGNLNLSNSSLFDREDALEEYITSNYTAKETITGAYAMADYQLSPKLSVIAGLRFENTNLEYRGWEFDVDNEVATQTATVTKSYNNLMPGVHFKYDISENQVIKFAWSNTIGRPNYYDLVPFANYSPDDETLQRGNPELEPTTSMNFDLMFENYFKSVGIVSIGGFHKNIDKFIYTQVIQNYNDPQFGQVIEFTSPFNGGTATVTGFEASVQRQLDFLPGFFKGFGVFVNYTLTSSTTNGVAERESDDLKLPGTAKNMFNASLSYETEKLVVRVSLNHASDYVDEYGGSNFSDIYYDKQTFLDVNASYAFTDKLRVFIEGNNLTNQPLRYYQGIRERTFQEEYYNARFNFGLKFDLFGK